MILIKVVMADFLSKCNYRNNIITIYTYVFTYVDFIIECNLDIVELNRSSFLERKNTLLIERVFLNNQNIPLGMYSIKLST